MELQYKKLYKPIILAMILAFLVTFLYQPTLVKNFSMRPTLEENDLLIVNNRLMNSNKQPKIGEIIVFKTQFKNSGHKEITMIKRVIALAGDRIIIRDGKVYVNSTQIEEAYLMEPYTDGEIELQVPEGKVFVMGDNRAVSLDSRDESIGLIHYHEIIGRARFRIFPFSKMGFIRNKNS
ncbi:signal peptidase I [Alkaliphilus transvaalensis]|uniref:signal peptidase I n=1 Tax=Alkaliphilus transvaalensis TaxID=114628 RepID=UPI00047AF4B0|nr:signal peptidase I [Alkaliphilus transvaalensis]